MLELSDYLALTDDSVRAQWRSILARRDPGTSRQVDFVPIETLICFGLGLVSDPSPSGNINIKESSLEVKALAALFKRRPTSLAAKLANLDGRRPNGAKNERRLWAELSNDIVRFEYLYEVILRAGRSLGLDEDRLPDFLGIEANTLQAFLDADRISNEELRESVDKDLREWEVANPDGDAFETERVLVGTARVGQKQFARSVLVNCDFACVFCGLNFRANGLPPARMLIASHIKPWKDSLNRERIDTRNGLAACPTHDAAFDVFLVTVAPDLAVHRSQALMGAVERDAVVARNFSGAGMRERLAFATSAGLPSRLYLDWHNARFEELEARRAGGT